MGKSRVVKLDEELFGELESYQVLTGVPIKTSVDKAVRYYIDTTLIELTKSYQSIEAKAKLRAANKLSA